VSAGAWRDVIATDDQGSTVVVGPVHTDQSLDKLRLEIDGYGWEVQGTARHLSAASFADLRKRGDGEVGK
jgi:hypothetical protein